MERLTLIGFGEAARVFASAAGWEDGARAFDIKTQDSAARPGKLADYADAGVQGCESAAEAITGSPQLLSLVTADQALAAAQDCARYMARDALYFDMNSVAPGTKRAAAEAIASAGAHYIDVAVMAPVLPARLAVPLLVSGPDAETGAAALTALGFTNIRVVGDTVGQASAIKMIRSVLVKGIEAVAAECMIAAHAAGLVEPVLDSLGSDWPARADYNLDRMLAHGLRRAAEMEEVARTLEELGVEPLMTRGTIARQRALGRLGVSPVPDRLEDKLAAIAPRDGKKDAA